MKIVRSVLLDFLQPSQYDIMQSNSSHFSLTIHLSSLLEIQVECIEGFLRQGESFNFRIKDTRWHVSTHKPAKLQSPTHNYILKIREPSSMSPSQFPPPYSKEQIPIKHNQRIKTNQQCAVLDHPFLLVTMLWNVRAQIQMLHKVKSKHEKDENSLEASTL